MNVCIDVLAFFTVMKHLQAIDFDLWLLKKWVTSEKKNVEKRGYA